ncbi:response regulator [Larkinella terrae]|uniref:Response regulator n=1 Tax=Larkinella terrae TaxID=2025311 RepID=A0A7K0ELN6_9BACT|nr:response regulator [Larkinella terrae]MRS62705.1 response regulator [Larkinella terrae]
MAQRHRIIIADDDDDDRLLFKSILDKTWLDCDVTFAGDGVELLEHLESIQNVPVLIFLDLNMPRMDGFTTLNELRSNPAYRSIPVIIFTTSSLPDHITRCYQLGANSYLTKPSGYHQLTEVISQVRAFWFDVARIPGGN